MADWVIYGFRLEETTEYRYIGLTTKGAEERFKSHGYSISKRLPVYDWINKHGVDSVVVDVVEECPEGDHAYLEEAERRWIKFYRDSGHSLLNCDDGGRGGRGRKVSTETRLLQSQQRTGRKSNMSEEARLASSERMRTNNPIHLNPHTPERKTQHSIRMSGEGNPMFGKTSELAPCYGRTGELHPMFGKTGKDSPQYGLKRSEEQVQRMRDAQSKIASISCPYCPKEGRPSNMKRWHFDNCKQKD